MCKDVAFNAQKACKITVVQLEISDPGTRDQGPGTMPVSSHYNSGQRLRLVKLTSKASHYVFVKTINPPLTVALCTHLEWS